MDLKAFIDQLDIRKACPKCLNVFSRVKQHAHLCFKNITDFSPYLSNTISSSNTNKPGFLCDKCDRVFKGHIWLDNHKRS